MVYKINFYKSNIYKVIFFVSFLFMFVSCGTDSGSQSIEKAPKLVPDHTPYIAGLIEVSPDTTHHYPEVVVGYMTDSQDFSDPAILTNYSGIYNTTLLNQLVRTSYAFSLGFKPESEAVVKVQGPLGKAKEQEVIFTPEGNGVYGDQTYSLPRIAAGRYRLRVILPDQRTYTATTIIPGVADIILPDSISVDVEYKPFGDGTPKEEDTGAYPIVFTPPENTYLTVLQSNSTLDREMLLLEPDEGFQYTDRSNYLRTGIGYAVNLLDIRPDTLERPWIQRLDKPKDKVWMKNHWWLRFSFFSQGIGNLFFPPNIALFATGEKYIEEIHKPRGDAVSQNDTTYLFDVSTIRKQGLNGKELPKEASDAIGFFFGAIILVINKPHFTPYATLI